MRVDHLIIILSIFLGLCANDFLHAEPLKEKIQTKSVNHGLKIGKSGNYTTESGGLVFLSVRLKSAPLKKVLIKLASTDESEGTIHPEKLVFSPENWNKTQTVTITGQDDSLKDGDQSFSVEMTFDPYSDYNYVSLKPSAVILANMDNDQSGFMVRVIKSYTTESSGEAYFTLRLKSEPTSNVTISLSSSAPTEGIIKPRHLIFSPINWNQEQKITIIGQDDYIPDKDRPYKILTDKAKSKDPQYQGLKPPDIDIVNREVSKSVHNVKISSVSGLTMPPIKGSSSSYDVNNTLAIKEVQKKVGKPGLVIKKNSGLTSEDGKSARFTVHLKTRPIDETIVHLLSKNKHEGKAYPDKLVFSTTNWYEKQSVKVIGQDDDTDDGDQQYTVEVSTLSKKDFGYGRLSPSLVDFINKDNDKAGLHIEQKNSVTSESGKKAFFTIKLKTQPVDPVIITFSSSNPREGVALNKKLSFTSENWNTEQKVVVIGKNDKVADGPQSYSILVHSVSSKDVRYAALQPEKVAFQNEDNDSFGLVIEKALKKTSEKGQSVYIGLKLKSKPVSSVTVLSSSSNKKEGIVSPVNLIFLPSNWNKIQKVKVVGVDDAVDDGDQSYKIQFAFKNAKDELLQKVDPLKIELINSDDDTAGVEIGQFNGAISENGETGYFTIRLKSEPTSDVFIPLETSDSHEASVNPNKLAFDSKNWNIFQTVTVKGLNDDIADGDQPLKIKILPIQSKDPKYQNLDPSDVDIINQDNDKAGFVISPISGSISEDGVNAYFTVSLMSQPVNDVTIRFVSNDLTEGKTDQDNLIFTSKNWNQKQTITVTGVDDSEVDGDRRFLIISSPAISDDEAYNRKNPDDVIVTNQDNNLTTFVVSEAKGYTKESGRSISFFVRLNYRPKSRVIIEIVSSDKNEGKPTPKRLIFTPENWDQNRKIVVNGVDDKKQDGDQNYEVKVSAHSKKEHIFAKTPPVILKLVNIDDDKAGVSVRMINKTSSEDNSIAEFSIRLNSQPSSSVVFLFSSKNPDEGKMLIEHAVFTEKNWDKEQIIRVEGMADYKIDGNQTYRIISEGAVSSDLAYNKMAFNDVLLVNKDLDRARLIVSKISNDTSEIGETGNFTMRLNSIPKSEVKIQFHSSDTGEGVIDKQEVVFDHQNWNIDQTITVTGIDDHIRDEDQDYKIVLSPSTSADGDYHGLLPDAVKLKNYDNKRITLGLIIYYLQPSGHLADSFNPSPGIGLLGGYKVFKNTVLDFSLLNIHLSGTSTKILYNRLHKIEQTIDFVSLLVGYKYVVFKRPFNFFVKPSIDFHRWDLQSTTLTDGTVQSTSALDVGFSFSLGTNISIYKNIFMAVEYSNNIITGGMANSQFSVISANINYPF